MHVPSVACMPSGYALEGPFLMRCSHPHITTCVLTQGRVCRRVRDKGGAARKKQRIYGPSLLRSATHMPYAAPAGARMRMVRRHTPPPIHITSPHLPTHCQCRHTWRHDVRSVTRNSKPCSHRTEMHRARVLALLRPAPCPQFIRPQQLGAPQWHSILSPPSANW